MRAKFIIGIVGVGLVMAIGAAAGIEYRPYEARHDMAAARALLASGQYQAALSAAEKAAGFGASGTLTVTDGAYSWGSAQLTVSAWSSDQITFVVPAAAPATSGGQYATVVVTNGGVASAPFEVSVQ